ncbi:hypothetical protein TVAG_386680 [Trichomonas vaginalis G3]|uniref:Uncharacterized protein n=1 Tax=Trichomonas vaginalis (strain ATCC PRA-98 / G3) TaxID=412133 RepID=A2G792_TRIV3|nr:hypothetical protein TVAGG3_0637420 [Trichomonas vaginalis G3]EAX86977.1 hypothetical protein TVAG_386680 [Trichomonas vaginalis G3]KAI5504937.1 hypothetical protein TVAGG3_0637420 [Trichomonas vaginalis G3]|eukprot:XP_001299907.1 hypothetical protein [Trichomonas vaginalis G3]
MKTILCVLNEILEVIHSNIFINYMKMRHLLILFLDSGPSIDTWTHFYENSVITETHTKNTKLNPTKVGNYYVTTCFFNGFEEVVVNIDKGDQTKLLISISGFNGTKTLSQTVYSNLGSCVIYRTCATKSIQTQSGSDIDGVFLFSFISNPNNKNIFEDSTVFDCGEIDKGSSINDLVYGNLSYSRNNITNNKCYSGVSLNIYSKQRYNISQSSFIDNKANYECFYIYWSGSHQFYLCNIIRNNASRCFNLNQATVTFEFCSIKYNNCPQTFNLSGSCSATIINSDYDGQTSSVTTKNPTNNSYNKLSHLSTRLCEAENKIENNFEEENDISQYLIPYQHNHLLNISQISSYSILSLIK